MVKKRKYNKGNYCPRCGGMLRYSESIEGGIHNIIGSYCPHCDGYILK